jgi:hypothetical protein
VPRPTFQPNFVAASHPASSEHSVRYAPRPEMRYGDIGELVIGSRYVAFSVAEPTD